MGSTGIIATIIIGLLACLFLFFLIINEDRQIQQSLTPCEYYQNLNSLYTPARCWEEIK